MHFALIIKFIKRFINNVFVFLINKINSRRFECNVWFEKYKHLFFFRNVHDNTLVLSNLRKFVDYENNLNNHFRNIINDNVVKHYMFEVQIDLSNERLWHRLYVNSINVAAIIMISLTKLNFYNFTFSITRGALAEVIKKTSSYLYSNNAPNFVLRNRRTNAIVTL